MNPFLLLPGTDDTIPFGMPGYMQVMSLIPGGAACGNSSCGGSPGGIGYCSYGVGGGLPDAGPTDCAANYLGEPVQWGPGGVPPCPTREL